MTHSPQLGDVQSQCCPFVSCRLRSQLKVKYLTNKYYTLCRIRFITTLLMEGFPSNLNDTLTSTRGLQSSCRPCVSSRSQLKVKYLTNKYYTLCRVRYITPLLREGFPSNLNDKYTLTMGCAEPMLPMCQLKVKGTVKGQILNKQILHIMSCQLYSSFTNERISFKLEWYIYLN